MENRMLKGFLFCIRYFSKAPNSQIRKRFLISIFFILLTIVVNISTPLFFKKILQSIQSQKNSIAYFSLVFFCASWAMAGVLFHIRELVFYRVLRDIIKRSSCDIFTHLLSLPIKFHTGRNLGFLTNSIERMTRALDHFSFGFFFVIVPALIEVFFSTGIIFYYCGYKYAIILLLTMVFFVFYTFFTAKKYTHLYSLHNEADGNAMGYAVDTLLNYQIVKSFFKEEQEKIRYTSFLEKVASLSLKADYALEVINIGQIIIVGTGLWFALSFAYSDLLGKTLNLSDFVMLQGYFLQLAIPLKILGIIFRELREAITDVKEIIFIMEQQTEKESAGPLKLQVISLNQEIADIYFNKVSFGYDTTRGILHDISFSCKNGQKIAFVGRSGSGKSTLMKLLIRFYSNYQGIISINHTDIKEWSIGTLRNFISFILQDPYLFNRSIRENICYAQPDISIKKLRGVIDLTCLEGIIQKLPQGLETVAGERGSKLSGGERQRINIARALASKAKIYIFDESTSYLDFESEAKIIQNITDYLHDKTCIFIAHRLPSIIHVDQIIVIDQGCIVQRGSHQSLIEQAGIYRELWCSNKGLRPY